MRYLNWNINFKIALVSFLFFIFFLLFFLQIQQQ